MEIGRKAGRRLSMAFLWKGRNKLFCLVTESANGTDSESSYRSSILIAQPPPRCARPSSEAPGVG